NKSAVRLVSTPMMHSVEEIVAMLNTRDGQEALVASGLLHKALRRYPDLMERIFFSRASFSQSIQAMKSSSFIKLLADTDSLKSLIRIRMEKQGLTLGEFIRIMNDEESVRWLEAHKLVDTLKDGVRNRLFSQRLTLPRYLQVVKSFLDHPEIESWFFVKTTRRELQERVASSMKRPTESDIRLATELVNRSGGNLELWFEAFRLGLDLKINPPSVGLPVMEADLEHLEQLKQAARNNWGDNSKAQLAMSWMASMAPRASNLVQLETILADGRVISEKYDPSWLNHPFFDPVRGIRGAATPFVIFHAWREKAPERFKRIYMHDGDYINNGLFALMANAKSAKEILSLIEDPSKKDYKSSLFGAREWIVPNIDKFLALRPTPEEFVKIVGGELWQSIEAHAAKTLAYAHTPEMFAAVLDTHFTISINGDKKKIPGMRLLWKEWAPKFFAMSPTAQQMDKARQAAKHGDSEDVFDREMLKHRAPTPLVARQKYKAMVRQAVRCEQVFAGAGG
ncbi:MAG: hypothetical protein AAB250_07370, partial [Bdellovibrionota bacterium]